MPIDGTDSNDTLEGTSGDDVINGFGGDDYIFASMGSDFVDGGDGMWDRLQVGARNPNVFPQSGSQTYVITASTVTSSSGSINTSFTGIELLVFNNSGTSFGDTIDASSYQSPSSELFMLRIFAGNGDDVIIGSSGSDLLYGEGGSNTIDAGAGFDEVRVRPVVNSGQTIAVTGAGGTVETWIDGAITNSISNAEVVWIMGANAVGSVTIDASGLTGFSGFLILGDNVGSDILVGSTGTDIFANVNNYTRGGDTYTGNGGADTFDYTFAVDAMDGDTITDFDFDDIIDLSENGATEAALGYELADTFIGTAAFSGTAGEYRFEIVNGQTLVQVDHNGDGVADETLTIANGGFQLEETEAGSNLLRIAGERVIGSDEEDTLTGSDVLDILNGLAGADTMTGLGGDDIYYVDNAGDQTVEEAGQGTELVISSVSLTLADNVENLTLSEQAATGSASQAPAQARAAGRMSADAEPSTINGYGNSLDNIIQGNSSANTLAGEQGNDTLVGGGGNDRLIGGSGADTLTGGAGRDTFAGTAADLNGDTITDFTNGDRIVISDATLSSFSYSLDGSLLNFPGGQMTLGNGVVGPLVVSAAPEGGVQLMLAPPVRANLTLTESGQDLAIAGNVAIFGTSAGGEIITLVHGDITLDASFNLGGDTVVLPGIAASYSAMLSGSFVIITSDTLTVAIPVGIAGIDLQFADSTRSLRFDPGAGVVLLGDQAIAATESTVSESGPPRIDLVGDGPDSLARLVLATAGQDVEIGGNVHVIGSTAPGETVTIYGGNIQLDASFNTGGDTIVLNGAASAFTATLSGSFVTLVSVDTSVSIPIGVAGLTVQFTDSEQLLRFDLATSQVMLGDTVVSPPASARLAMAVFEKAGDSELPAFADHYPGKLDIADSFAFA